MSDDPIGTQPPSPQLTEAAAQPAAPAAQPAPATPDLASLLSEFEASTAAPKIPEPQHSTDVENAIPATPAPAVDPIAAGMQGLEDLGRAHAFEQQVKSLTAEVEAARTYIDYQHFDQAVGAIEKKLSDDGLAVPASFVRDSLISMSVQDEALRSAFDNRGTDPAHFNRLFRKAQHRIYEAARMAPDREATQDRAAVAQAVRGTSTKHYVEPAPQYGSMTDAEFQKEKAKFGI